MSENLKRFLVGLASDPERMKRYAADPAAELDGAGLSPDERAAVLSRDARSLRRALNAAPVDHMTIIRNGNKSGGKPGGKPGGKTGGKKGGSRKAGSKRAKSGKKR